MLKNYLKIAIRQLSRSKFYSAINILGLAIGLASCLLIIIYVQDELSYDQFHKNKDRIYRITEDFKTGDDVTGTGLTPYQLALDLKDQFAEIEKVVRIDYDISSDVVEYGDKKILQTTETSVDPDFFDVFSFKLLQGNQKNALIEPNTVVISDEKAKVYFPAGDAMGKVLRFVNPYHHRPFTAKVTGVFKAMPKNSHFHKDFLLSSATADILIKGRKEQLGWTSHFSYLLLSPKAYPIKLEKEINKFIFNHYPKDVTQWWSHFPLQSLNDIHLHSNLKEELEPNGDITYVYIFSAIAFIIILLACINYMNLSTARAAGRAKEIGVRKVAGALKHQLIYQLLGESLTITFLALIISITFAILFIPLFNSLSGKELEIDFLNSGLILKFVFLALVVGIISGSYPAFFLSSFNPVKVLKGTTSKVSYQSLFLRKGLVVFQFSISIILIVGTFIIYNQWNYLQNKKLGIKSDQVIIVPTQTEKEENAFSVTKKELLRISSITGVTASDKNITSRFGNYMPLEIEGKRFVMPYNGVDADFFLTFGIPLIEGSYFKNKAPGDSTKDYIINEAASKLLGFKSPIGRVIDGGGEKGKIIGVVKNFHFESLHAEISPVIFATRPTGFGFIAIKAKSADLKKTLRFIEDQYKSIDPEAIFKFSFLDDDIASLYKTEAKFLSVFTTFSALAIFIACIGILGLASFTAFQRRKEIGIRKVLGATVKNISFQLTSDFITLVLIANLFAWPVAWYFMKQWLQTFPYRIEMNIWIFLFAGVSALFIAVLTVSFQAIKAAIANPVKSLRTE